MKIRSKFIFPIAGLVILSVLVAVVSVNMTVSGLVAEQEAAFMGSAQDGLVKKTETRQQSIYSSIDLLGKSALKQAALFSELPEVQDAYYIAHSGDMDDENDVAMQQARQKLRLVMSPYVDGLTRQTGVKEFKIHFHTPSGRSLARIWRQGWQAKRDGKKVDISDDLTSFRQTVIDINKGDHKPLSGIEIGRGGFALRGLSAISGIDGEHLGSCEVLLSFGDVLKANHTKNVDYEIAVYMLAEQLPIATKLQDPKKNPLLDGKYVFTSSTNPELTNPIITSAMLDAGRHDVNRQSVGNKYIASFPVPDFSGKVVGVMTLVYDMAKINALAAQVEESGRTTMNAVNWRFGAGGLVLVVIFTIMTFIITKPVTGGLKNVSDVMQNVAEKGDLTVAIDEKFSQQKDEIGDLSRSVELMLNDYRMVEALARQLAEGNLTSEIHIKSPQDLLGQALSQMLKQMNGVLSAVGQAAIQIDSGSEQVSDTAQSLSQGATESAASLEEISSSMNEIGSQTQQSADNAGQANQLTNDAQSAAKIGSERMESMVTAMGDITVAGQNISKIIKVIDEIAFQTNLLALNAAVEAARAGQHGKGFAVVAEEVRNLAARSAKAAEETAQLIEGSVEKTENGAQLAGKTSEALEEIVVSITKVTDLVAEIAAASSEQAQGITQINQGLGQIDQAVQVSTATSEESAASAEELSSQAAHLKHLLSRFTLANSQQGGLSSSAAMPAPQLPPTQTLPPRSDGWADMNATSNSPQIQLDDDEFGKF